MPRLALMGHAVGDKVVRRCGVHEASKVPRIVDVWGSNKHGVEMVFSRKGSLSFILRLIRLDCPTGGKPGGSYQSTPSDWTPIQREASIRFSRSAWQAWQLVSLSSLAADFTEYINHHTVSSQNDRIHKELPDVAFVGEGELVVVRTDRRPSWWLREAKT